MLLRSFCRLLLWCIFLIPLCSTSAHTQTFNLSAIRDAAKVPAAESAVALPEPLFIGMYAPDGIFWTAAKSARAPHGDNGSGGGFTSPYASSVRPVPDYMNLHSIEDIVFNFEPPARTVQRIKTHSWLGTLRDGIVTFAYGREWILVSPTSVTTDSRLRVIIADPHQNSVHVLEPKARNSFRIAGGPHMRLREPTSVAVDAEDNIYVGDRVRGVILVFSPQGVYLRSLGELAGESLFQDPTSIAIDRKKGRLYVLDSPMRELIVLDLEGHVLKRVGGRRKVANGVEFENPSQIALGTDKVAVLDSWGSRVLVLNTDCQLVNSITVRKPGRPQEGRQTGLAVDSAGNLYVSNPVTSTVDFFGADGRPLGILGHAGGSFDGFSNPGGIWIDSSNRMFVADTSHRRVQMFQVNPAGL